MRMLLFFDLPSTTKTDVREYTKFVKLLKKNGFAMMQESVYFKLAITPSVVEATMGVLRKNVPKDGTISILTITEKQFSTIDQILGEISTDLLMDDRKIVKL